MLLDVVLDNLGDEHTDRQDLGETTKTQTRPLVACLSKKDPAVYSTIILVRYIHLLPIRLMGRL